MFKTVLKKSNHINTFIMRKIKPFILLVLALLFANIFNSCIQSGEKTDTNQVWSIEKANAWHEETGWLSGCNFQPSTAVNALEVFSDKSSLQIYYAWLFDGKDIGKSGKHYEFSGGFIMESQGYPDAPNHGNFPKITIRPGELYIHKDIYKFSITNN